MNQTKVDLEGLAKALEAEGIPCQIVENGVHHNLYANYFSSPGHQPRRYVVSWHGYVSLEESKYADPMPRGNVTEHEWVSDTTIHSLQWRQLDIIRSFVEVTSADVVHEGFRLLTYNANSNGRRPKASDMSFELHLAADMDGTTRRAVLALNNEERLILARSLLYGLPGHPIVAQEWKG